MPIVNACLGGLANAVPSGQAKLNLTWITNDGENQQVTFVISGTASKSVQSDANGYASVQLPVGTYTVSVTHGGEYIGDDPKTITLASRETGTLTWLTGARNAQVVTFNSPYALTSSSTSYSITLAGTTVESGKSWSTSMTFNLYGGTYVLTLSIYGVSTTYEFTVPKNTGIIKDLSALFTKLTVSAQGGYELKSITVNGYSAPNTDTYSVTQTCAVLRAGTISVGGTVNYTGEIPQLSGVSTGPIYSATFSKVSLSPTSDTATATLPMSKKGIKYTITSAGTLTVPTATYRILCVGGGGGGGVSEESDDGGGGGGGGGFATAKTASLGGNYTITIGAGGAGGEIVNYEIVSAKTGGTTSFGTILSASGGRPGGSNESSSSGGFGGTGGSGGGGGGGCSSSGNYANGGKGGNGDYGGGGGGGSAYSKNQSTHANAGAGGTSTNGYGGNNGNTASSISDGGQTFGGKGGSGVKLAGYEDLYTHTPYGGDGGGLYSGRRKPVNKYLYNIQGLGGEGGYSPLGSGGKPILDTTSSTSRYYRAGRGTGYGSGGSGGCAIHYWQGGYRSGNGASGTPGAIVLMYKSD